MDTSSPDPLDPDIVYGGKLTRYDRRTAQAQNIMPVPLGSPDFRVIRTEPVIFSPVDPHLLYFAVEHAVDDARWRPELEADQPRPDAQRPGTFRRPSAFSAPSRQRSRSSAA